MIRRRLSQEDAEAIAVAGLALLANEPERLDRFLALSGLVPTEIRALAATAAFQAAVLAHIRADESFLLMFAANIGIPPELVGQAEALLGGSRQPSG